MKDHLDRFVPLGLAHGWNVQTTAAVVSAFAFAEAISQIDMESRERAAHQVMSHAPANLGAELAWLSRLRMTEPQMDALAFRYIFIGAILASWLVKDRSIDSFTKSLFATVGANALAGLNKEEAMRQAVALMGRIGDKVNDGS